MIYLKSVQKAAIQVNVLTFFAKSQQRNRQPGANAAKAAAGTPLHRADFTT